jgi:uncharacterized repeat protein (TIGR03803 family)
MDYGLLCPNDSRRKAGYLNGKVTSQTMKTQIQNLHLTKAVTLPHRRTTSRFLLRICLAMTVMGLVATPWLRARADLNLFVLLFGLPPLELLEGESEDDVNFYGANPLGTMWYGSQNQSQDLRQQAGVRDEITNPGKLFGTASVAGSSGSGTVFSLNTDGSDMTVLHNFTGGSDGSSPAAGLVLSGNTLYGTTINGGNYDNGVVFAVTTGGTNFTVLHHFTVRNYPYTNYDGGNPYSQLILSGNILYGTTSDGGRGNAGTVFALNLLNTNFTVLHSFAATAEDANFNLTNSDGANPYARLLLSGNVLYGTTSGGGPGGAGTVFALNLANTNFAVLHSLAAIDYLALTNTDGATPYDGLILSGKTLYGTASRGGNLNLGTIFAVNTNGTDFTNLYSFTGGSDGAIPRGELLLYDNLLIGTASSGGDTSLNNGGNGTVFGLNTSGTSLTVLHTFAAGNYDYELTNGYNLTNSEGASPSAGLIVVGNTLYGSAIHGGNGADGTVFSLTLVLGPNILSAVLAGTNLVINGINGQSGKTNVTLTSPNLTLPLNQWTPVATNILNVNGNFTFTATNAVDPKAPQRFYILQTQ